MIIKKGDYRYITFCNTISIMESLYRKVELLKKYGDVVAMPMCPDLCPDSNLSKLEVYLQTHRPDVYYLFIQYIHDTPNKRYETYAHRIHDGQIQNIIREYSNQFKLCMATANGTYEYPACGSNVEDYEEAARNLLEIFNTSSLDKLVLNKKNRFNHIQSDEYKYRHKMDVLSNKMLLIPELFPNTYYSKVEAYLLKHGGYLYKSDQVDMNVRGFSPVVYIAICDNREISDLSITTNVEDLEEMFQRIYHKLCSNKHQKLVDGKTYFVHSLDNYDSDKMNEMHIGKYDSASETIGNKPLKHYIELRTKDLKLFSEYIPFVPNIEQELQGKQIHRCWLLGDTWFRRIDIEFEGIQFGYPTYKMYVNSGHTPYIIYKNGQFYGEYDIPLTLSAILP